VRSQGDSADPHDAAVDFRRSVGVDGRGPHAVDEDLGFAVEVVEPGRHGEPPIAGQRGAYGTVAAGTDSPSLEASTLAGAATARVNCSRTDGPWAGGHTVSR
jgi:hypothetical protein